MNGIDIAEGQVLRGEVDSAIVTSTPAEMIVSLVEQGMHVVTRQKIGDRTVTILDW